MSLPTWFFHPHIKKALVLSKWPNQSVNISMFKWQKSKAYKCTKASSIYTRKYVATGNTGSSFKLGCHKIAAQTILWLSYCNLNRFQWIWGSSLWLSVVPYIPTFHLRVTLMTKICIHLELFCGRAWEGDAIQDLQFIGLFAGVGSHNIHIQTFPGLKWIEKT